MDPLLSGRRSFFLTMARCRVPASEVEIPNSDRQRKVERALKAVLVPNNKVLPIHDTIHIEVARAEAWIDGKLILVPDDKVRPIDNSIEVRIAKQIRVPRWQIDTTRCRQPCFDVQYVERPVKIHIETEHRRSFP